MIRQALVFNIELLFIYYLLLESRLILGNYLFRHYLLYLYCKKRFREYATDVHFQYSFITSNCWICHSSQQYYQKNQQNFTAKSSMRKIIRTSYVLKDDNAPKLLLNE